MSSYISGKHFIKTSCVTSGLLTLAVWGTLQPLNLFAGDESAEKLNLGKVAATTKRPAPVEKPAPTTTVPTQKATSTSEAKTPLVMAAEVDRLLLSAAEKQHVTPASLVTDEDFLRRVSLDLGGVVPTAQEVTMFCLDPARDKRTKMIEKLLGSEGYGEIWAAYWAEVIFSRATEQRARTVITTFESWMHQELEQNRAWDQIATTLLTANGKTREEGQTALMFAHFGDPAEVDLNSLLGSGIRYRRDTSVLLDSARLTPDQFNNSCRTSSRPGPA